MGDKEVDMASVQMKNTEKDTTSTLVENETPNSEISLIETEKSYEAKSNGNESENVESKAYFDEHCVDCKVNYKDPPADTMLIYLHAIQYSGEGWKYRTDIPKWAQL